MNGYDRFLVAGSHLTLSHFIGLLSGVLIVSAADIADYKAYEAISLTAWIQPLSFVLQQLSEITDCTFIYDNGWSDLNITVRVENLSLDKTLRKILNNLNFAILYMGDGNVRINIYDNTGDDLPLSQTEVDRPLYQQMNIEPAAFGTEDHEKESESAGDPTESDTEISDSPADEQDADSESSEREATDEGRQHTDRESHENEESADEVERANDESDDMEEQEVDTEGSPDINTEESVNPDSEN